LAITSLKRFGSKEIQFLAVGGGKGFVDLFKVVEESEETLQTGKRWM
jgi:hypothetical protein